MGIFFCQEIIAALPQKSLNRLANMAEKERDYDGMQEIAEFAE